MADFTEETIAKALRDAYGQGFRHACIRTDTSAAANDEKRDAWIQQYVARLPLIAPFRAALDPRVERIRAKIQKAMAGQQDLDSPEAHCEWLTFWLRDIDRTLAPAPAQEAQQASATDDQGEAR